MIDKHKTFSHQSGDVQLISGCTDEGTSQEGTCNRGSSAGIAGPVGALTLAICDCLRRNHHPSYLELVECLNKRMKKEGKKQRPQLSSSQKFDPSRRLFSLDDICPNTNPGYGRLMRKKFNPAKKVTIPSGLEDILSGVIGMVGRQILGSVFNSILR
jgi:hypothetical protein